MRSQISSSFAIFLLLCSTSVFAQSDKKSDLPAIATAPEKVKPLEVGAEAPQLKLKDSQGNEVDLAKTYSEQPTVLVFFRGGWCPICTSHTNAFIKAMPELEAAGAKLIGVSPDSVDSSQVNVEKNKIPFLILSDPDVMAARAFGLAFQVDDQTVQRYQGFGIDLVKASGKDHKSLPVPAVYIIDTNGKVAFAHSDPDYRKRLDVKKIIEQLSKL